MAAEIGPGTLLECIKAGGAPSLGISISVGRTYTCEAVVENWGGRCSHCAHEGSGLILREAPTPPGLAWCPCAFRPLPPRSKHVDALLEKFKTPAKVPEPA